ncbi:MAG: DUF192 domain-containing protein [bacterium]
MKKTHLRTWFLTILTMLLLAAACGKNGSGSNAAKNGMDKRKAGQALPTLTIDGTALQVEIVQEVEERQLGLMHREQLPENQGMLFVFETTHILSFWMRNTFIPLDIAFITESGQIVDIQRMAPLDESKSYISSAPALYALEVNAGWFERNGIKVGSHVSF